MVSPAAILEFSTHASQPPIAVMCSSPTPSKGGEGNAFPFVPLAPAVHPGRYPRTYPWNRFVLIFRGRKT